MFEFLLAQKGFERILAPYAHNLRKLGIELKYRTVDVSLYVQRSRSFNFDMMVASFPQSQSPGNEQLNMWHSSTADQDGSNNSAGIKDPVVDALVEKLVYAPDRKGLIAAARAWIAYCYMANMSYRTGISPPTGWLTGTSSAILKRYRCITMPRAGYCSPGGVILQRSRWRRNKRIWLPISSNAYC